MKPLLFLFVESPLSSPDSHPLAKSQGPALFSGGFLQPSSGANSQTQDQVSSECPSFDKSDLKSEYRVSVFRECGESPRCVPPGWIIVSIAQSISIALDFCCKC